MLLDEINPYLYLYLSIDERLISMEEIIQVYEEEEVWQDIPGYDFLYQASTLGRIRSYDKTVFTQSGTTRTRKGRLLNPHITKQGYSILLLTDSMGTTRSQLVHRLVALTFIGEIPDTVDHINQIPYDNSLRNLRLANRMEQYNNRSGIFKPIH